MRTALLASMMLFLLPCSAHAQGMRGIDLAPLQGTKAPDFELQRLNKDGSLSKETVKLGEVSKKKPVALVFGSYT